MVDLAKLDRAFNPRCVVVVGDKGANGYLWLQSMIHLKGYGVKLYSVQIDPKELEGIAELGVANYSSLLEVPDEIDYVVCAVPRRVVPRVLQDCAKRNIGAIGCWTSGFAETDEEGRALHPRPAACC